MNQLNKLTVTLNAIKNLSKKIISTAIPIMKELENSENDLLDEFLDSVDSLNEKEALEFLQDISLSLVKDAECVVKEIESFSGSVVLGEEAIDEGEDEYPFLMMVWYGDTYGIDGIEGLNTLVLDLQKQLADINEDNILEIAIGQFKEG